MKSNRGITLIAMIVTIIVLLILSYISIFILMGDNGILNKSIEAKKAKVGDYVAYNDTSDWRVIENSASGIKIISNTTTITQRIGNSGESTSLSYSNAVSGLNSVASNAINSYATLARSVEYNDIANLTTLNMISTVKAYWFANTYTYGNQYHVGVIDENGIVHPNLYNDAYSLVGWSSTQYATMNKIFDVRVIVTLIGMVMTNDGDGSKENSYKLC